MSLQVTLDAYFEELERTDQFSGVVLIAQGEKVQYERAYGYANRTWQVPNTMQIRFDTASITKLFTAIATLQLIEQGHFTLSTPVIPFLGLQDTTISDAVEIQHLLLHTSGIGDDADEEAGEDYEDVWKTRSNYMINTTEDLLPQFIHKPANFAPGQGCRYCNVSYILLGLMIEHCTGMSYREYVHAHVFTPAGMADSGFFHMQRLTERVAEGCDPVADASGKLLYWKRNIYSYPPIGSPDGGAHVTAADLVRFMRAVHAKVLLGTHMTQAFLTPQVLARQHPTGSTMNSYGLKFFVSQSGQVLYYEKDGINAGVSANLRYYPTLDTTTVLLSNMVDGAWGPLKQIQKVLGIMG